MGDKIFVLAFYEWPFYTCFTVVFLIEDMSFAKPVYSYARTAAENIKIKKGIV